MAEEKSPTYGLQSFGVKDEAPNDEEEQVPTQIVYRCPHKRGEGGRCHVIETDLNLLLNHFYKHHARERILKKSNPKFAMCCFRQNCPSKFQNHMELVEHMWGHDNDPAENIYFTEYIKELFEKENKDLGLDVKELSQSVKELKEEVNDLKADRKMLKADNSKMKETTELKIKNKDLELHLKMKDLRKQEVELKDLKEDKAYYRDKYHSEQKKNKEYKTEIEENGIVIEKQKGMILEQKGMILEHQEKDSRLTTKINLKDGKIKELEAIIRTCWFLLRFLALIAPLIIEIHPSSSSTDIDENSMKKDVEEKDKIIKDMKRREKILKMENKVLKLNNKLLKARMTNSCPSSDSDKSDESLSDSDDTKDGKKSDKKEKRKNNNLDAGLNEGRKTKNPCQSSFDEFSDTEKRNSGKKKRKISPMHQEYFEKS